MKMKLFFSALFASLIAFAPAYAATIDDYSAASTPLAGTERLPGNQGTNGCTGCTVKITSQSIANLATKTTVGLSAVTNDAQTKAAIVPNTAPTAGQILAGNAGGTAYAPVAMSGSCTMTSAGVVTCTSSGSGAPIPQTIESADYTAVIGDANGHILHPSADVTARTFTIPANASVAYPIGTTLSFVDQNSAGTITISITSDTMRLAGAGTTGDRTLSANGIATALKITATEWIISGVNLL